MDRLHDDRLHNEQPHNAKTKESSPRRSASAARGKTRHNGKRFFTLPVITLILMSFMLGTSEFIVVGILPDIAGSLNTQLTTIGNLVSVFAFVYAPCTPFGSAIVSRHPRFATQMVLTVVFLIGNIMCAVAPNYAVLFAARVLIAMVAGTLVSMSMTYAPDVVAPEHRTRFVSWIFSGFSVAAVAGVPLGTWIANMAGWRWAFHTITMMTVVLMGLMIASLPKQSTPSRMGVLSQFMLFSDRRIQCGIGISLCGAAATYVFYTYLAAIMQEEIGLASQYVSIGMMVYGVGSLWGNLYSARLAARGNGIEPLSRMTPIFLAWAFTLCALIVARWVPVLGAVLLLVLGMFMYLLNSPAQILYVDVASATRPGSLNLASSLNSMSYNIGIALGAAVGGLVAEHLGLMWLGPVGSLFAFAAAALTIVLKRENVRNHATITVVGNVHRGLESV